MVRDLGQDQRKHKREIQRIITQDLRCDVPGCNEYISFYKGLNSDTKCREHSLQGKKYGGNASPDRLYTYHKLDHCDECGFNPYKDRQHIDKVEQFESDADMKNFQDKLLTVDHINGDHSDNRKENCRTLCHNCHNKKTHINKDWLYS